jgi:hypothetical protein
MPQMGTVKENLQATAVRRRLRFDPASNDAVVSAGARAYSLGNFGGHPHAKIFRTTG